MSLIFDQGVSLPNFDPAALAGLANAGVKHADVLSGDVTLPIEHGDVIDGQYLYACGTVHRGDASGLYSDNCNAAAALPGRWMCLGHLDQVPGANYNVAIVFSSTFWMRVE